MTEHILQHMYIKVFLYPFGLALFDFQFVHTVL